MRLIVPIALLVALVVAGVLLFDRPPATSESATPPGAALASAVEGRSSQVSELESQVAPTPAAEARVEVPTTAPPAAAGSVGTALDVRVLDGDGQAVERARVRVWCEQVEDAPPVVRVDGHGALAETLLADAEGRVVVDVPPGEYLQVTADGATGTNFRIKRSTVPPLEAGEIREIEIRIERPRGSFHGLVVDAVDESPLADVAIHARPASTMMRFGGSSYIDRQDFGQEVTRTDPSGRFVIDLADWGDGFATAKVVDHVPGQFRVDEVGLDPARPLLIRLDRGASLVGTVDGLAQPATITATCASYHLNAGGEPVITGGDIAWRATIDELDGSFELGGLLPETPLVVEVLAGRTSLLRVPQDLVLEQGERREVHWSVASGATARVIAVDANGAPQPQVVVRLYPGPEVPRPGVVPDQASTHAAGETDDSGTIVFRDLQPGRWVVAPGHLPDTPDELAVASLATFFDVAPGAESVDVRVTVHRGLWITGRCEGPDGQPMERFYVSGAKIGGEAASAGATTDADGNFRLGPLVPGLWRVSASTSTKSSGPAPPEPQDLPAGTNGAQFRFREASSVTAVLIDPTSGEQLGGRLEVQAIDFFDFDRRLADPELPTRFGGLIPGRYNLLGIAADGRRGAVRGLHFEAGDNPGPIEVRVAPVGEVLLRYTGPQEYANVKVEQDGVVFDSDGLRSGTSQVFAAPLGQVTVRYSRYLGGLDENGESRKLVHEESVEIRAGEVAEVVYRVEDE
ncbi:carboxypeptidase-like regulatory domain-containing protein [Engelhardtia mirabilis]|uniref:Nickel uptake substrate-specific transmembrane region n=1 Tax=Engelhardtia mirabilis TaxID=2528011 RepID=A0A518BG27_9BACT|nr:Nickel uptake substrate-specific transmembrane region [Planctomycetes bacterium Pla133]QDV00251.1 Nickel uptake substrate-specific transmembrane region [Planctomycetes bacterium Pla86]